MKKAKYWMTFYKDLAILSSLYNKQTMFFSEMLARMDSNQIVQMTQYVRKEIITGIGCKTENKLSSARQYLKTLSDLGLVQSIGDGAYMINPKIHGHNNFVNSINEKTKKFIKIKYDAEGKRKKIEVGIAESNKAKLSVKARKKDEAIK